MRAFEIWVLSTLTAVCAQKISTSGRCGPDNGGLICTGSRFGNCCSQYGWCGKTPAYCGQGCQVGSGKCNAQPSSSSKVSSTLLTATRSSSASSAASSPSSIKISTNARCGHLFGATGGSSCLGSKWGNCCSQYSYCGSTSAYCGTGCQDGFGKCSSSVSSYKASSSSLSRTPTASSSSTIPITVSSTSSSASLSLAVPSSTIPINVSPISSSASFSSAEPSSTIPTNVSPTSSSAGSSSAVPSLSTIPSLAVSSSADLSTSIWSSAPLVTTSSTPEVIPSSSQVVSSSSAAPSSDTPLPTVSMASSDAPTASSSSSVMSSSIVDATPTLSPSSTVVCYPAPTNYFANADFESSSGLAPWTNNVLRGSFSALEQTSDLVAVHSGTYGLRVSVPTTDSNAMFFEQANVPILAGTQLVASMWVKILAPPPTSGSGRAMSIQMYIDGSQRIAQILPSQQPQNTWINVKGTPFTLSGTSTHTISVYFGVTGYTGAVLAFDDISLVAISGPPGQPLCT